MKKWMIWLIVILIILAGIFIYWFYFRTGAVIVGVEQADKPFLTGLGEKVADLFNNSA